MSATVATTSSLSSALANADAHANNAPRKRPRDADQSCGNRQDDDEDDESEPKKMKEPPPPPVVTGEVRQVQFVSDHAVLQSSGNTALTTGGVVVQSIYGAGTGAFAKPEWVLNANNHPISHTKNQQVTLNVQIHFDVQNGPVTVTRVEGATFEMDFDFDLAGLNVQVNDGDDVWFNNVPSTAALPNMVDDIQRTVFWNVTTDQAGAVGQSTHRVLITFGVPGGQLDSVAANTFLFNQGNQDITVPRLAFAIAAVNAERGNVPAFNDGNPRHHVDAIFRHLRTNHIQFFLGRRWEPGGLNNTNFAPKPTLHHYLWMSIVPEHGAAAECHNIAAALSLICKALGIPGTFEVGYMYPWPRRAENYAGGYPQRVDRVADLVNNIPGTDLGRYNQQFARPSLQMLLAIDKLCFVDQNNGVNNFEGVCRYTHVAHNVLYAIGEHILAHTPNNSEHWSTNDYYANHNWATVEIGSSNYAQGSVDICFAVTLLNVSVGYNLNPYPTAANPLVGLVVVNGPLGRFRWQS